MRRSALHLILLISLLVGLPGCSGDVTGVRVIITFSSIKPDQVAVTGVVSGQVRFKEKRFPVPARPLFSGDDVIFRNFPETDDGKVLTLTVQGLKKAVGLATSTAKVVVRKGNVVSVTVHLGPKNNDGGPKDLGPKLDGQKKDKGKLDGKGPDKMQPDLKKPDQGPLPDKGCTVGSKTCNGNDILSCVAGDGGPTLLVQKCPLGCVPVQCKSLLPSNGLPTNLLGSGTVKWQPTAKLVTINTSNGVISDGTTVPHVLVKQTAPGGQIMAIAFSSISVPMGTKVEVTGNNALALVASGSIEIKGIIDASAKAATPGPGGGEGGSYFANAGGAGPGGKGCELKTGFSGLYTLGGGGGGVHSGAGGAGGAGELSTYTCPGGSPSASYGKSNLVPLSGGSGGGRGGTASSKDAASGGGGGGALMLVSGSEIIIGDGSSGVGGINSGGGGGGASGSTYRGGGGGGAGGAILLEAPKVVLKLGATLAVNGGGGGGGSGTNFGAKAGLPGDMVAQPSLGGSASTGGGAGGNGAGGALMSGGMGSKAVAGGGGGGSAGIVRINTISGSANIKGSISGAMTQGKVQVTP